MVAAAGSPAPARTGRNALVLIAHDPLASALRSAAMHILPAAAHDLVAVDVNASLTLEANRRLARSALQSVNKSHGILLLADIVGATPCNIASWLVRDLAHVRLLAGVNLAMLLRALTYRNEPLDVLLERAREGGATGVVVLPAAAATHGAGHDA